MAATEKAVQMMDSMQEQAETAMTEDACSKSNVRNRRLSGAHRTSVNRLNVIQRLLSGAKVGLLHIDGSDPSKSQLGLAAAAAENQRWQR